MLFLNILSILIINVNLPLLLQKQIKNPETVNYQFYYKRNQECRNCPLNLLHVDKVCMYIKFTEMSCDIFISDLHPLRNIQITMFKLSFGLPSSLRLLHFLHTQQKRKEPVLKTTSPPKSCQNIRCLNSID